MYDGHIKSKGGISMSEVTRINLNMDNVLLNKIGDFARKRGINRTAAISFMCAEYLEQKDTLVTMGKMVDYLEKEEK